jgi:hypothetical protein
MAEKKAIARLKIMKSFTERSNAVQLFIIILALVGGWGLFSGLAMLPEGLAGELSRSHLLDLVFNLLFGSLVWIVAGVLLNGKVLGLWLFAGVLLLTSAYNYLLGRGFNLLLTLVGAYIAWQMFRAQRRGELT